MLACLLVSEKENPFIYLPETKALIYINHAETKLKT